jgi:hypothetical protein
MNHPSCTDSNWPEATHDKDLHFSNVKECTSNSQAVSYNILHHNGSILTSQGG